MTFRPRAVVLHTVGVVGATSPESIRDYHVRVLGWADAGYHWYVRRDGDVAPLRPESRPGAHTHGANDSLGVCFEGDGDRQPWTYAQWRAGLTLLVDLLARHGLGPDDVCGHREAPARLRASATAKTCPGRLVDCDEVRAVLAAELSRRRPG